MLKQHLEKAKNDKHNLEIKLILCTLSALITMIASIIFFFFSSFHLKPFFLILATILLLISISSVFYCIANIQSLNVIKEKINDILFRQSLPTEYYYDVTLNTNTITDIYIKQNSKNLCIRYVESIDAIQYKYKLNKKKYRGTVTVEFAKKLFNCEFFNNF